MKKRAITIDQFFALVDQPGARRAHDGTWIGACTSTHIYCRTVCPAVGHVNRGRVRVHASAAAAEKAGFRPCLTCCPEAMPAPRVEEGFPEQVVAWAAAVRANVAEENALEIACAKAGFSTDEAAAACDACFDVTPEEYLATERRLAAKQMLRQGNPSLDEVAAACGFASGSALAAEFKQHYKLDAQKLADKKPHAPRLSKSN